MMNTTELSKAIYLWLILLIVQSITVSCHRGTVKLLPATYSSLCDLSSSDKVQMTKTELFVWVEAQTEYTPRVWEVDGNDVYTWGTEDNNHVPIGVAIMDDDYVVATIFRTIDNGPTFEAIINNFGPPDAVYRDYNYDTSELQIGLAYKALGITVSYHDVVSSDQLEHDGALAVSVERDMQVSVAQCYPPTSDIEEFSDAQDDNSNWPGFDLEIPLD